MAVTRSIRTASQRFGLPKPEGWISRRRADSNRWKSAENGSRVSNPDSDSRGRDREAMSPTEERVASDCE